MSYQFDTLAKAEGSLIVSYPLNALAKAEGSLAVSYPLDSLAKAKGSCSVIPVENGADHMLISSNDNQEMQVSQTEGFGERNVERSGQQFGDLEHPFAQHMKSVIAMNLESSKRKCPRFSQNVCCSCLDICLQSSGYTFMCNTFLAVIDTGPSLL